MAVTLDTLKKTIGKKKVKSMAFAWLADYECMAGDVENALARVDAGLGMYPGDIPGMLVRTKILFQKGDFEECIKECERVLEKEPFCLSAQKRMGEAYEQLENIDERNRCFRRVHDMDPLDTFWKEEYEAVPEENVGMAAGAVAGAAAEAMGDADFAMPDLGDMAQPQGRNLRNSRSIPPLRKPCRSFVCRTSGRRKACGRGFHFLEVPGYGHRRSCGRTRSAARAERLSVLVVVWR